MFVGGLPLFTSTSTTLWFCRIPTRCLSHYHQNRHRDEQENIDAAAHSPEGDGLQQRQQSSKRAAAGAVDNRRKSQAAPTSKKPRPSTAPQQRAHNTAAAAPDTEAKPLSERLAANRKRSLAQPQTKQLSQQSLGDSEWDVEADDVGETEQQQQQQGVDDDVDGPAPKKAKKGSSSKAKSAAAGRTIVCRAVLC